MQQPTTRSLTLAASVLLFGAAYDATLPAFPTTGFFCTATAPTFCHLPLPGSSDPADHTVSAWSVAASGMSTNQIYATVTNFVTGDHYKVERQAPVFPSLVLPEPPMVIASIQKALFSLKLRSDTDPS